MWLVRKLTENVYSSFMCSPYVSCRQSFLTFSRAANTLSRYELELTEWTCVLSRISPMNLQRLPCKYLSLFICILFCVPEPSTVHLWIFDNRKHENRQKQNSSFHSFWQSPEPDPSSAASITHLKNGLRISSCSSLLLHRKTKPEREKQQSLQLLISLVSSTICLTADSPDSTSCSRSAWARPRCRRRAYQRAALHQGGGTGTGLEEDPRQQKMSWLCINIQTDRVWL